jgi:hypothetical protein
MKRGHFYFNETADFSILTRQNANSSKFSGFSSNDPFGSRPEPGAHLIASNLLLSSGEVPEGRARGVQDTATRVQSESEG